MTIYLSIYHTVTPRFPKYVETGSRRESATYIREENTPRIHAKPKVTRASYKNLLNKIDITAISHISIHT